MFDDDRVPDEEDPDPDENRRKIIGMGAGGFSSSSTQNAKTAFASSRPERPTNMKSKRTMTRVERRGGKYVQVMPDGSTRRLKSKTDWTAFDALTDAEVHKAALSDPDAQPLTRAQLAKMRRISRVKHLRWKLGLSQAQFAERFQIPVGTLRDWEQHRSEPDQAAMAYLKVIEADADFVARAVA